MSTPAVSFLQNCVVYNTDHFRRRARKAPRTAARARVLRIPTKTAVIKYTAYQLHIQLLKKL